MPTFSIDELRYKGIKNPTDYAYGTSTFKLVVSNAFYYDNPLSDLLLPQGSEYSHVEKGVLNHVKSRVFKPFEGKFEPSVNNQYFFKPINIFSDPELEAHARNGHTNYDAMWYENNMGMQFSARIAFETLCNPMSLLEPFAAFSYSSLLMGLYVFSAVINFCQAVYYCSQEYLDSDCNDYHKSIDHLKQTASLLLIGASMPVVVPLALAIDAVRLVTRLTATIIEARPLERINAVMR